MSLLCAYGGEKFFDERKKDGGGGVRCTTIVSVRKSWERKNAALFVFFPSASKSPPRFFSHSLSLLLFLSFSSSSSSFRARAPRFFYLHSAAQLLFFIFPRTHVLGIFIPLLSRSPPAALPYDYTSLCSVLFFRTCRVQLSFSLSPPLGRRCIFMYCACIFTLGIPRIPKNKTERI